MVSCSKYLKWYEGEKSPFLIYSSADKHFNEFINKQDKLEWLDEFFIHNNILCGVLDFAKVEKGKVVEFIECKVRTHNNIDWKVVLQVLFYETITKCENWRIIIYNRKYNYLPYEYSRNEVLTKYKYLWDLAQKHLKFIYNNYEQLNKIIYNEGH